MKKYFCFIGMIFFLFCSMRPDKDNLLTGTWKAVEIKDENGKPCSNDPANPNIFIIKISNDGKFNSTVQKSNGSWQNSGLCKMDTVNSVPYLDFYYGKKAGRMDIPISYVLGESYPIVSFNADSLVIKYNFCCDIDTCDNTSGWITFIKENELKK